MVLIVTAKVAPMHDFSEKLPLDFEGQLSNVQ